MEHQSDEMIPAQIVEEILKRLGSEQEQRDRMKMKHLQERHAGKFEQQEKDYG